jgi:hypothetical protein
VKRQPDPWLDFVVDALAVYRLTRLATKDTVTEAARERWIETAYETERNVRRPMYDGPRPWHTTLENDDDPPKLAYLITCPFCVSVYVAVAAVAARTLVPGVWRPVARAAALGAVGALLGGLER